MNEALSTELLSALSCCVTDMDDARRIVSSVLINYEVQRKTTDLAIRNAFPEEAKIYLAAKKIDGLAMSTLNRQHSIISRFFNEYPIPIDKVTANHLRLWLYGVQDKNGTSNRTLDGYRNIICQFFAWLNDEGYLDKNPMRSVKKIKYAEKRRPHLTRKQVEMIRACCTPRERAIFEFYLSTGCRCTEITTIRMRDIDINGGTVSIFNQKSQREKTCYLSETCQYWLSEYLAFRYEGIVEGDRKSDDFLFISESKRSICRNGQLTKAGVESIINRIGKRAGVYVTPGIIRHTLATMALNNGADLVDVMKMLDHKNPKTTLVYADRMDDGVKAAHKRAVA